MAITVGALAIAAPLVAIAPAAPASAWSCTSTIPSSNLLYGHPFPAYWTGFAFKMTQAFSCGHSGTDWDLMNGTQDTFPVWAVTSGTVYNYTDPGCYGNYARLQAADGVSTLYAHLQDFGRVASGAHIDKGENIGWAGHTGTCPKGATHLHLATTKTWNGWASSSTYFFNSRTFLHNEGTVWTGVE